MAEPRSYPPAKWEVMRATIYQLYIKQNMKLGKLREHLEQHHDFFPTKNKLLDMLKAWKFKKYSKAANWQALQAELDKRKLDLNQLQQIEVDGRFISVKKAKKEIGRYGGGVPPAAAASKVLSNKPTASRQESTGVVRHDGHSSAQAVSTSMADVGKAIHIGREERTELEVGQTVVEISSDREISVTSNSSDAEFPFRQRLPARWLDPALLLPPPSPQPMLHILHLVSPTEFFQTIYADCSEMPPASEVLLRIYMSVRSYLLSCVLCYGDQTVKDDFGLYIGHVVETLETVVRNTEPRHHKDKKSSSRPGNLLPWMECFLPSVSSLTGKLITLTFPVDPLALREVSTIFFIFYVRLNNLVSDDKLDGFTIQVARNSRMTSRIEDVLCQNNTRIALYFRTEFWFSAIRIKYHRWARKFFDIYTTNRLSWTEIDDGCGKCIRRKTTPIQAAVLFEDCKTAISLIEAGLNINNEHLNAMTDIRDYILQVSPVTLAAKNKKTHDLLLLMLSKSASIQNAAVIPYAIRVGAAWSFIAKLIAMGASLDEVAIDGEYEMSAVHAASSCGNVEILGKLLDLGLTPDGVNETNLAGHEPNRCGKACCTLNLKSPSPLMLAIKQHHREAVLMLLRNKCKIGAIYEGQTALSIAIEGRNLDLVAVLLPYAFLSHVKDDEGVTAADSFAYFTTATRNQDTNMLGLFFEQNLQVLLLQRHWECLLSAAAKIGAVSTGKLLLDRISHRPDMRLGAEAFEAACYDAACGGHIAFIELLVDSWSSTRTPSALNLDRSVKRVARNGHYAAFRWMVSKQFPSKYHFGTLSEPHDQVRMEVLLSLAAAECQFSAVICLLEKGAGPLGNLQLNEWIGSPVENAVRHRHVDMLRYLLQYMRLADSECDNSPHVRSALETTILDNLSQALPLFPRHGAICLHESIVLKFAMQAIEDDRPAIDLAVLQFVLDSTDVGWVNERPSILRHLLCSALKKEPYNRLRVDILLRHGASVNDRCIDGLYTLQEAIHYRRFDLVRELLERGAHVDAQSLTNNASDCQTAVQEACSQGHVDSVKLLLSKLRDPGRSTSLGHALLVATGKGFSGIVQILLEMDSHSMFLTGYDQRQSIEMAAFRGRVDVLKLLLGHCEKTSRFEETYEQARRMAHLGCHDYITEFLEDYRQRRLASDTS